MEDLKKSQVLQETRIFNDSQINPKKCSHLLIKILYLIGLGEKLNESEATDIYFSVTKLFISEDVKLFILKLGCFEKISLLDY
jgi:coatomer subunit gamma